MIRLIARSTIEEAVLALHAEKRDLAEGLLAGADIVGRMSTEALADLVRHGFDSAEFEDEPDPDPDPADVRGSTTLGGDQERVQGACVGRPPPASEPIWSTATGDERGDPKRPRLSAAGEAMKVEDIDRFIDRWRATLTPAFTPEYVDGFMRRHRGELHALVLKTLARRGAEGGEAPDLLADFMAYDIVAAAQRSVDAQPDAQVLRELWRHVDAQFAQGYNELSVFHNFAIEFIDARTEAIFLRDAGWDVVPLLLERPALAIVAGGHVVAVRDWRGWLKIHPERRGTLNHLFAELDRAEEKLLALREELGLERNTKERLMKYATATWKHARKASLNLVPSAAPNANRGRKQREP